MKNYVEIGRCHHSPFGFHSETISDCISSKEKQNFVMKKE